MANEIKSVASFDKNNIYRDEYKATRREGNSKVHEQYWGDNGKLVAVDVEGFDDVYMIDEVADDGTVTHMGFAPKDTIQLVEKESNQPIREGSIGNNASFELYNDYIDIHLNNINYTIQSVDATEKLNYEDYPNIPKNVIDLYNNYIVLELDPKEDPKEEPITTWENPNDGSGYKVYSNKVEITWMDPNTKKLQTYTLNEDGTTPVEYSKYSNVPQPVIDIYNYMIVKPKSEEESEEKKDPEEPIANPEDQSNDSQNSNPSVTGENGNYSYQVSKGAITITNASGEQITFYSDGTSNVPVGIFTPDAYSSFIEAKEEILKSNEISSIYNLTNEKISKALADNEEEFKNAKARHVSDSMYYAVTNKVVNGQTITIAHIVITDPSQIKYRAANGSYASGLESIEHAKDNCDDWEIGFNGSFFLSSGRQDVVNGAITNSIVIVNGELVDTSSGMVNDSNREELLNTRAKGHEICIDKDGKMFSAPAGVTARELIEDYGVVNTFVSHEEQHLENNNWIAGDEKDKWKNRPYLCMVEPGEYYVVQGNGQPKSITKYIQDELGCTYAKSLDQGGSVAMATKDEVLVKSDDSYDDGIRPVGDFLYFSD